MAKKLKEGKQSGGKSLMRSRQPVGRVQPGKKQPATKAVEQPKENKNG